MLKSSRKTKNKPILPRLKRAHPYQTMLYFGILTSVFLFLALLALYTIQRFMPNQNFTPIVLPKAFIVSTIVLLVSSFALAKAKNMFFKEQIKNAVIFLFVGLMLGLAFAALQIIGWLEFYYNGFGIPNSNTASSYIYIISGMHLFHVLFGICFLLYILIPAYRKSLDPVQELIFLTNPYEYKKVSLFTQFWHYIDGLWFLLFMFFVFTSG